MCFPGDSVVKNLPANAGDEGDTLGRWIGKIPWRRKWQLTPVFLPGEFNGQRSLVGYSSWDHKESNMTEWLAHVTKVCMGFPCGAVVKNPPPNTGDMRDMGLIPGSGTFPGQESGNSLQYSCLENPMDRGTWWTTIHGVIKSHTQLSN